MKTVFPAYGYTSNTTGGSVPHLTSEASLVVGKFRKKLRRFFVTLVLNQSGHISGHKVIEIFESLITYLGSKEGMYVMEIGSKLSKHHIHAIMCINVGENDRIIDYGEVNRMFSPY